MMLERRSAWNNLSPRCSGLPIRFCYLTLTLIKYIFKKCSLLLWSLHWSDLLFCWILCPTVCAAWFSITISWPLWPEPTDCTMGLSDHSGWIKEAESSFHSVNNISIVVFIGQKWITNFKSVGFFLDVTMLTHTCYHFKFFLPIRWYR